jgi:WD40 repeat protein
LWNLNAPAPEVLRGHDNYVYAVSWLSPHSRIVSASWDGTVRTWDAKTGQQLAVYEVESEANRRALAEFESPFIAVDCSRDGARIAAIRRTGTVHVWEIATGRHQVCHDLARAVERGDVEFLPDDSNRLVYQRSDGFVTVRNLSTGEQSLVCQFPNSVHGLSVSGDGTRLALGLSDGTVRVWDLPGKQETAVWENESSVNVVKFSRSGRLLASGHSSGLVRIWDVTSGRQVAELVHPISAYGLDFSPDGTRLATGGADGTVRLWDTQSWQSLVALAGHEQYVHSLEFSDDGSRLISGSGDHTVRIWNASSEN